MGRGSKRRTPAAAPSGPRSRLPLAALVVLLAAAALGFAWQRFHPRRPNLLLVTIDTLRADHVGAYGAGFAHTPTLDALAARGARFEHAETAVPMTGPSHATILTGLYPPVHGVRDNVVFSLDPSHKTLATLLKTAGYRTAAFVGAYPVAAAFGFKQGFETFTENFKESEIPGAGAQRRANEVIDDALDWLGRQDGAPWFAWVHLYDPHAPYDPPEPYRTTYVDRPYDGEIAFADAQLGRALDWLRASGHEADTVVAVLADHGESLGEHRETTHAVLVYEATLRVPLLLAGPGVPPAVVSSRVSTVDVAPTLLRLLDVEPPFVMRGRDLRPALRGQGLPPEPLYAESLFGRLNCRWSSLRAWTTDDGWKLVDGSRAELFRLEDDPGESHDLSRAEPERVARLRAALRSALGVMAPAGDQARATATSPERESQLKSLGYVGGSGGAGSLDEPGLPDPRDRVELYDRLQVVLRAQNIPLDRATDEAAAIAAQDPGNPFAHSTVASLAYRRGRLAEAEAAYRRSLALDPDQAGVRQNYGKLLRDMDRLPDSERELRAALAQTDADDVRTRASLAQTLALLGKNEEALHLVADALRIEPHDPESLAVKGRLSEAAGRFADAEASLSAAADGGDVDARIELARFHLRRGEAAKARSDAERVLSAQAGHPWALAVLGQAQVLEGRRDLGLATLRRAEALHPRRPEAWSSLADGFAAAQDQAAAARCRAAARALSRP